MAWIINPFKRNKDTEKITPKQVFEKILRSVNLELKPLGFKRIGQRFWIRADKNFGLIEFHRSKWNTSQTLAFNISITIYCGALLQPTEIGIVPVSNVNGHLSQSIGSLMPNYVEWWTLNTSDRGNLLTLEIIEILLNIAVPYIKKYSTTRSLLELWESGEAPGLTDFLRDQYVNILLEAKNKNAFD